MMRLPRAVYAVLFALQVPFLWGQVPARVRGTITGVRRENVTVKQDDGATLTLPTGAYTTYCEVVSASLQDIKLNDYIGTASKGSQGHWVAVEIVLVPEAMRPGRLGYGPWDGLPDYALGEAAPKTETTMTNGFLSQLGKFKGNSVQITMTNGTVAKNTGGAGDRVFSINLAGGGKATILVRSGVPVTRFVPADRAVVTVGAKVFITTDPGGKAGLIAVGRGLSPPM